MADSPLAALGRDLRDLRESPQDAVSGVLEAFTAITIGKLKRGLNDKGRKSSGALEASIAPQPVRVEEGNLIISIEMEDYWDFVNQGVNGTETGWGSEYLFRPIAQTPSGNPPTFKDSIQDWMAFQGIKQLSWVDKDGEYKTKNLTTDKDFEQAAFAIMQGIKKNGIEPSFFVDDALNEETITGLTEGLADAIVNKLAT
jgi:hypothetical protein